MIIKGQYESRVTGVLDSFAANYLIVGMSSYTLGADCQLLHTGMSRWLQTPIKDISRRLPNPMA